MDKVVLIAKEIILGFSNGAFLEEGDNPRIEGGMFKILVGEGD